jgi:hypothetical protein
MDERLTKEEFIKIAGIIVCSEGEKIIWGKLFYLENSSPELRPEAEAVLLKGLLLILNLK